MSGTIKRFYAQDKGPIKRKNYWLPCVLNAELDNMTEDEQVKILNATRWADLLTNAEWPVMLQDASNPPVKSRLKKKIVHWLMILGRIAALNPELFAQACREAFALYAEQLRQPHPLLIEFDDGYRMLARVIDNPSDEAEGAE